MQYGIRLSIEDISYGEYKRLFSGLTGDTPLVQIVNIRTEKDIKKVKQFSKEEKKVYDDWKRIQNKKKILSMSKKEYREKLKIFQETMKSAFYKGGGKGM